VKDPREWTPDERQAVVDFHVTFRETTEGRRVLDILRRDLWDVQSGVARGILLDDRSTIFNEGRRDAFATIRGYLEAYDLATGQG